MLLIRFATDLLEIRRIPPALFTESTSLVEIVIGNKAMLTKAKNTTARGTAYMITENGMLLRGDIVRPTSIALEIFSGNLDIDTSYNETAFFWGEGEKCLISAKARFRSFFLVAYIVFS